MKISKEKVRKLRHDERRKANLRVVEAARESALSAAKNDATKYGMLFSVVSLVFAPFELIFPLISWLDYHLLGKKKVNSRFDRKRREIENKL